MKIDAHYYAVLAFSRACGFKKQYSADIAYASQYVDDAIINQLSIADKPADQVLPHLKLIESVPCFFDMATCHTYTKVKTFNYTSMIKNTSPFHFIPGCDGNNFVKQMRCKENGIILQKLFDSITSRDADDMSGQDRAIMLGIFLHVFADSYSHQGFSGLLSKVNDIKNLEVENNSGRIIDKLPKFMHSIKDKIYTKLDRAMPAYGHGQAGPYPDLPYLSWSYTYDSSDEFSDIKKSSGTIDNTSRYKNAFSEIVKILDRFAEKYPDYRDRKALTDDQLKPLFDCLVEKKSDKKRINHWIDTITRQGLFDNNDPRLRYNKNQWLEDAFLNFDEKKFNEREVYGAIPAENFEGSKWYSFYKAVHQYKNDFFTYCEKEGQLMIPH